MTKNDDPIFGPNGTILNADEMRPQNEWPKPEPQGMTRRQIKAWIAFELITLGIIIACVIWIIP